MILFIYVVAFTKKHVCRTWKISSLSWQNNNQVQFGFTPHQVTSRNSHQDHYICYVEDPELN